MSGEKVKEFQAYRDRQNERLLGQNNLVINRLFNLDSRVYEDGALNKSTKELMGLVASLVLRCDDCVNYHLLQCHDLEISDDQLFESFSIALMVGGSITIPHLRRATEFWDNLKIPEDEKE
ncbi:MAG: carboxymuconolactone decarboxylase family protein [Bacteroidia bacterium]